MCSCIYLPGHTNRMSHWGWACEEGGFLSSLTRSALLRYNCCKAMLLHHLWPQWNRNSGGCERGTWRCGISGLKLIGFLWNVSIPSFFAGTLVRVCENIVAPVLRVRDSYYIPGFSSQFCHCPNSPPIFFFCLQCWKKKRWEGLGMRYMYIVTGRTLYVHVPITSGVYMLVGEWILFASTPSYVGVTLPPVVSIATSPQNLLSSTA